MKTIGEDLLSSEVIATHRNNLASRVEADRAVIADHMMRKTATDWEQALNAAHVPATRARILPEALGEPQIQVRGVGIATYKLSHGGPEESRDVPRYGQHTNKVLMELGFPVAKIMALRRAGVID